MHALIGQYSRKTYMLYKCTCKPWFPIWYMYLYTGTRELSELY